MFTNTVCYNTILEGKKPKTNISETESLPNDIKACASAIHIVYFEEIRKFYFF